MKELFIKELIYKTKDFLDDNQRIKLEEILTNLFYEYEIVKYNDKSQTIQVLKNNEQILNQFLSAKEIEGCSNRTLKYYKDTINKMMNSINKLVNEITTEDLRDYLSNYKENSNISTVTIDNTRRVMSSFFTWLENEDYIVKSPVRRIHKVKVAKKVKETLTDENLEKLRDTCSNIRDLAMLELLISTGMRVGELTRLNISDLNLQDRSCIVLGKGNSEREVYFMLKAKCILKNI